jgi:hypothetical protein
MKDELQGYQDPYNPGFDAYIYLDITKSNFWKHRPKLKIAHVIGKTVWDQGGDIRGGAFNQSIQMKVFRIMPLVLLTCFGIANRHTTAFD